MRFPSVMRWLGVTMLAFSTACVTGGQPSAPGWRIVVVRHAEKAVTGNREDPGLSAAGTARAHRIAQRLQNADVQAVYATAYRRTRETASPTAQAHGLMVTDYPADEPARAFVDRLHRTHGRGTVLVIGHSNTVPAIVSALCHCTVAPIDDASYDNWYDLWIDATGTARLQHIHY